MSGFAFTKILIANRGEIALRIVRTARDLGYRTVAVYSEADRDAPHVAAADQAVPIGPAPVAASYLNIAAVIEAAERSGADAVHPGYGFLAENAAFAEACAAAGLVFIGPDAAAIELMGNKAAAKRRMTEAGVPCVAGYDGDDQSEAAFAKAAEAIGYPVMVKAAAGGGGRGMRLVADPAALAGALGAARSEAEGAFGSGELILERALVRPRHVEIQIFADGHGNVIHLGERDCSIQRRHQKVIEEAPSPAVDAKLRAAMGAAAVAAARAIDYRGAGTVEFLLDADGAFYFLEMNTRLQVEHPVTEMVTGFDLVAWQLRIAAGEPLPVKQDDVAFSGHAIEARLYAEDPANGFLPQSGRVALWRPWPSDRTVRVDAGIAEGQVITPFYDPMIAKVIAWGSTRADARRRLIAAIEGSPLLGLTTNRLFLIEALRHEVFAAGAATTAFVDEHLPAGAGRRRPPDDRTMALAAVLLFLGEAAANRGGLLEWRSAGDNRTPLRLSDGANDVVLSVTPRGEDAYGVEVADKAIEVAVVARDRAFVRFAVDDLQESAAYAFLDDGWLAIDIRGETAVFRDNLLRPAEASGAVGDGMVLAPMHGRILAVDARKGDTVTPGQRLVVLEAMKMEHEITADIAGTVAEIAVKVGDQVAADAVMIELTPEASD